MASLAASLSPGPFCRFSDAPSRHRAPAGPAVRVSGCRCHCMAASFCHLGDVSAKPSLTCSPDRLPIPGSLRHPSRFIFLFYLTSCYLHLSWLVGGLSCLLSICPLVLNSREGRTSSLFRPLTQSRARPRAESAPRMRAGQPTQTHCSRRLDPSTLASDGSWAGSDWTSLDIGPLVMFSHCWGHSVSRERECSEEPAIKNDNKGRLARTSIEPDLREGAAQPPAGQEEVCPDPPETLRRTGRTRGACWCMW